MATIAITKHSIIFHGVQNTCLLLCPVNNIQMCDYIYIFYHIFCCNVFVFACPIIAKSQCWLFAALKYPYLSSYIRICPRIQLPVSAQWFQSPRKHHSQK